MNGKTTGATLMGTTENGPLTFIPMFASIHCTNGTAITITPTLSIGTNSTSFNNIVPATLLSVLSAAGVFTNPTLAASGAAVPANTSISVNITIGAVATTMTIDIHLFGYYK